MLSKKLFFLGFVLVLLSALVLRLFILKGNNFYFTVDQGRDAVYVREILESGRIFLKGPETNIRRVFAGPGFYYFTAVGYFLTGGHPLGGVLMIIALNLSLTALLVLWLRSKVGNIRALIVGAALQFFWPFFETSLWSFNPFPLVFLSFVLIFLSTKFLTLYHRTSTVQKSSKYYYWGIVPVALAFNAEVAGALVLFIFYILVGLYGVIKKLIPVRYLLVVGIILPLLLGLILGRQFVFQFVETNFLGRPVVDDVGKSASLAFSGTNFRQMIREFTNMMASTTIPQNKYIGEVVLVAVILLYYKYNKKTTDSISLFVSLSFLLFFISFLFFSSNMGWRSWHTVYLPSLLFVLVILMLYRIPKKISVLLFSVILLFQFGNFVGKYQEYMKPNDNPSLLYNQLNTIDWIYIDAKELGFKAYNYTDTFYDYPYQYLFWWYGINKYGYLPDEYSNFPLSAKELYVPGYDHYLSPARSGLGLKYLIIQSDTNGEDNTSWPEKFKLYHDKVDETKVGNIRIEKYVIKNGAPNDLCIWWQSCQL